MESIKIVKTVKQFLEESGFTFQQILSISEPSKKGQVDVTVDVGSLRQRIGHVVVDARSGKVVSHEIPPL